MYYLPAIIASCQKWTNRQKSLTWLLPGFYGADRNLMSKVKHEARLQTMQSAPAWHCSWALSLPGQPLPRGPREPALHRQHMALRKLHAPVTPQGSFSDGLFGSDPTSIPSSQPLGAAQLLAKVFLCSAGFGGTSQQPVLAYWLAAVWEYC